MEVPRIQGDLGQAVEAVGNGPQIAQLSADCQALVEERARRHVVTPSSRHEAEVVEALSDARLEPRRPM
jgi:hypothetical protein